ncbi:hypothetical protein [Qipengyuania oceanensis]|uniref:Poly A polymerase head domain-containing protein n=1 Tax=Qipengyuania oceanensis TaxID=1463597 RepID=A0A844YEB7_9SPHN|nr:hypothetical protein [Qipengyuania oceanensis]MXO61993.1 hypothetical protein [Qipengyuania oceanensis]
MSLSASTKQIKRRVDDYVWYDKSQPLQELRHLLRTQFLQEGEVAIIGGMVRDIATGGAASFSSDVDLVLNIAPNRVDEIARSLNAVPNRFGGYGIRFPRWKVDFWALRNTWAHTQGHVRVRELSDLTKTTFFNVDAVLYTLNTRKVIAQDRYLDSALKRKLEVNLLPNPSIDGNLVRTVRRALRWNYHLGRDLRNFVSENLDSKMFDHIVRTENRLYGFSYAELHEDYIGLLDALFDGRKRRVEYSEKRFQMELPF